MKEREPLNSIKESNEYRDFLKSLVDTAMDQDLEISPEVKMAALKKYADNWGFHESVENELARMLESDWVYAAEKLADACGLAKSDKFKELLKRYPPNARIVG